MKWKVELKNEMKLERKSSGESPKKSEERKNLL
jgi:hypothetical protein